MQPTVDRVMERVAVALPEVAVEPGFGVPEAVEEVVAPPGEHGE
jgi:hypothetical protein